jgi:hypothetical protein
VRPHWLNRSSSLPAAGHLLLMLPGGRLRSSLHLSGQSALRRILGPADNIGIAGQPALVRRHHLPPTGRASASHEVLSSPSTPAAAVALSGAASHRTIPSLSPRSLCPGRQSRLARALAPVGRSSAPGTRPGRPFRSGHVAVATPPVMHRRSIADDVPLPALGHTAPGRHASRTGLACRQRSWGSSLRSLDPVQQAEARFRAPLTHTPLPSIRPRLERFWGRVIAANAFGFRRCGWRPILGLRSEARLLGFQTRWASRARGRTPPGPILPWALPLAGLWTSADASWRSRRRQNQLPPERTWPFLSAHGH